MLLVLLLVQAAAPVVQAAAPADIEIGATVQARSLTIEKQGEARLTLHTSPEGENLVDVQAPEADGRRTLRNVRVTVRAEARIADPQTPRAPEENTPPR